MNRQLNKLIFPSFLGFRFENSGFSNRTKLLTLQDEGLTLHELGKIEFKEFCDLYGVQYVKILTKKKLVFLLESMHPVEMGQTVSCALNILYAVPGFHSVHSSD